MRESKGPSPSAYANTGGLPSPPPAVDPRLCEGRRACYAPTSGHPASVVQHRGHTRCRWSRRAPGSSLGASAATHRCVLRSPSPHRSLPISVLCARSSRRPTSSTFDLTFERRSNFRSACRPTPAPAATTVSTATGACGRGNSPIATKRRARRASSRSTSCPSSPPAGWCGTTCVCAVGRRPCWPRPSIVRVEPPASDERQVPDVSQNRGAGRGGDVVVPLELDAAAVGEMADKRVVGADESADEQGAAAHPGGLVVDAAGAGPVVHRGAAIDATAGGAGREAEGIERFTEGGPGFAGSLVFVVSLSTWSVTCSLALPLPQPTAPRNAGRGPG